MARQAGEFRVVERILVVDDELLSLEELRCCLETAGYEVYTAEDGAAALHEFQRAQPHLVILDLLMPDITGWEVCRQLRVLTSVPIVMLTGLRENEDVIRGLNAGADDYLVKPIQCGVLLARVRAILRRTNQPPPAPGAQLRFGGGDLVIDPVERRVVAYGKPVQLTLKEYQLLLFMAHNAGRVLSIRTIFDHVWAYDADTNQDSVKWYVWRVRSKIEQDAREPRFILTERGIGYRFALA